MADQLKEDDFEQRSTLSVDWLKRNGSTISSKVELADLRNNNAGRGVVATEDIAEGEELFRLPRTAILTVNNSTLPSEIREKFEDPWLSMIIAMIWEYQQGAESAWKPYFDVLPDTFDTLVYWSNEELECLRGSAVLDKIGKQDADQTFREDIIPVIQQHTEDFRTTDLSDEILLSLCHRMGSTIMAYAFDLEASAKTFLTEDDGWEEDSDSGEGWPKAMIPWADMLNAAADKNNAKLYYEDDEVVMKTVTAIKKGDELFNDYGPLPRADVLRRYGYVDNNYAKYDVVEISVDLIKQAALETRGMAESVIDTRLAYLDEQGILEDGYEIERSSTEYQQFSEEFALLLNVLVMPDDDFAKLKRKGKLPKADFSTSALHLLQDVIARRRALYTFDNTVSNQKISDNVGPASADTGSEGNERRRNMALQVIDGEKEVLQEAADTVERLMGHGQKRKADVLDGEAPEPHDLSKKHKEDVTD